MLRCRTYGTFATPPGHLHIKDQEEGIAYWASPTILSGRREPEAIPTDRPPVGWLLRQRGVWPPPAGFPHDHADPEAPRQRARSDSASTNPAFPRSFPRLARRASDETEEAMKGHARRKGDRWYAVIYEGIDPVTERSVEAGTRQEPNAPMPNGSPHSGRDRRVAGCPSSVRSSSWPSSRSQRA